MTSPDTSAKLAQLRAQVQAAAWIARLNNPQPGVNTERDLQCWINESEEHAKAWELAEVVWKETGVLASEAVPRISVAERSRADRPHLDRFAAIRSMDGLSGIVLVICGATAASLSARGAYALFAGSWLAAIAFATVVQFVVAITLWEFPRKPLGTQALLVGTCAVAMLLSIGSTYCETYRVAADGAVVRTRDSMVRELLTAEIQHANEAALQSSEPDPGSAEWRPKEGPTSSQTERMLQTRSVVSGSIAVLKQPDRTMEDLQRIYSRVEFQAPLSSKESARVANSLFAASIMEVLSLMVAVIRSTMLEAHLRQVAVDGATKLARATQRVQESTADPDAEAAEQAWEAALTSEIQGSGSEWRRLVVELLPGYGALSRPAGRGFYCPTTLFDPRVFSRRPAALHGALTTGAVLRTSEGELIPGARWEQWIRFLLAKLPNASPASCRLSRVGNG